MTVKRYRMVAASVRKMKALTAKIDTTNSDKEKMTRVDGIFCVLPT
jgi:hypothetical protein